MMLSVDYLLQLITWDNCVSLFLYMSNFQIQYLSLYIICVLDH